MIDPRAGTSAVKGSTLSISGDGLIEGDLRVEGSLCAVGGVDSEETYKINGQDIFDDVNTLNAVVTTSELQSVGTLTDLDVTGNINTAGTYQIGAANVFDNATTLSSAVTASGLQSVGTLTDLTVGGNVLINGGGELQLFDSDVRLVGTVGGVFKLLSEGIQVICIDGNQNTGLLSVSTTFNSGGNSTLTAVDAVHGSILLFAGVAFNRSEIRTRTGQSLTIAVDNGVNAIHMTTDTPPRVGINDMVPAEVLDVTGNINATGVYKIGDANVFESASTLGTGVTSSSLTDVGTLDDLTVAGNLVMSSVATTDALSLPAHGAESGAHVAGDMYFDTGLEKLRICVSGGTTGTWETVTST